MSDNPEKIEINPHDFLKLYLHKEYDRLSEVFIQIFVFFQQTIYIQLQPSEQYSIDIFIKNFLYLFTQPDYITSDRHSVIFIRLNHLISNLVAISAFKKTDSYLEILKNQPNNFVKILTLYSPRNSIKFNYKELFDANPYFASLWYSYYYKSYISCLVAKESCQNLQQHLAYIDERFTLIDVEPISDIYFGATYIDADRDRAIKEKVNQLTKAHFTRNITIKNTPHPKQIAIITAHWFAQHSVYRNFSQFVEALKDDYELTLIHLSSIREDLDISAFKNIRYIQLTNNTFNIDCIQDNKFTIAYFPDVGMATESIILANLRIAPIQIGSYGHSVSTFGSEIDYFIGGADVENTEKWQQNYSERLVLIPGFGCINNRPLYEIRNIKPPSHERFVINCSWYSQKTTYTMLATLKQILERSPKKLLFRFFSGGGLMRDNHFLPFSREVKSALGTDQVDIVPNISYPDYMALMEQGDIGIDAYHFGGCNTVVDSLYVRKPIVTFEGQKWYNRIGSELLRVAGLSELIATDEREYIELILRLIQDKQYLGKVQDKLNKIDLDKTIFNFSSKQDFKKAIEWLTQNHEQLKNQNSKAPIFIR